ncbi:MAG: DUF1924 domain-containing protein [Gammaproteobacteria bacterium]|nr:DUF1924 domain-containing protein [Gammaproteobacteria bacterium]
MKIKKHINPIVFGVNKERYIKIKKWFKRNCKWTWGKECTAQEKDGFIECLLAQ